MPMVPLHNAEALWINFGGSRQPAAVMVGAGAVNAISGERFVPGRLESPSAAAGAVVTAVGELVGGVRDGCAPCAAGPRRSASAAIRQRWLVLSVYKCV